MKKVLVWATLLALVGTLAVLLKRSSEPKPITRAALRLKNATKPPNSGAVASQEALATAANEMLISGHTATPDAELELPRWAPRPPEEWQGMLIDLNITPPCTSSDGCSLGRACLTNKCMPCVHDQQCAAGETCVLQHCLLRELATCRLTSECGPKSKCILSGYSTGPRGNEGMSSACVSNFSGAATMSRPERELPSADGPSRVATSKRVATNKLVEAARAAAVARD